MMDSVEQRMTSGSVAPIAQHRRKPMTVNSSQPQVNTPEILDFKSIVEIELVSLTEDREKFNKAELNFIHWLDAEITKIDDFYYEKEQVAAERYKLISAQLDALRQLRDSHQTNESN